MRSVGVLIIGAGASGMMAAIGAKKYTKNVLLIEKMSNPGKKILATGNGRCNYTNYKQSPEYYHSSEDGFAWKVIKKMDQKKTVDLFASMGIMPSDRDGYVYPFSGQAVSVRNVLVRELERLKTEFHQDEKVISVKEHISNKTGLPDGYIVTTEKDKYLAKKIIIATGGKASPVHGSDGDGYLFAKALEQNITEPVPALTYCTLDDKFSKEWSGVRVKGNVTAFDDNGNKMASDFGELQMVTNGISGIPVFQISRYISMELSKGKRPYINMDIMPSYTVNFLKEEIAKRINKYRQYSIADIFEGMLHQKLIKALLISCGISSKEKASAITENEIDLITKKLKSWRLNVTGTGDFTKAQVTCGGVDTSGIDSDTMESKTKKGLYFSGEVVDVDGICGGYNLQWAWSSGYIAGISASKALENEKNKK